MGNTFAACGLYEGEDAYLAVSLDSESKRWYAWLAERHQASYRAAVYGESAELDLSIGSFRSLPDKALDLCPQVDSLDLRSCSAVATHRDNRSNAVVADATCSLHAGTVPGLSAAPSCPSWPDGV